MYIIVKRPQQLEQVYNRRNLLIHCVMNNCSHCISSQPEWNSMVQLVKHKLHPQDAIVQVESQFMDSLTKLMRQRGVDFPEVRGYPSTFSVTPDGVQQHEGRARDDYIKVLKQIKAISEEPRARHTRKKSVKDPRLAIIEKAKGERKRPSRKGRRRRKTI